MVDLPDGQELVFDMVNSNLIEVWRVIAEQERAIIRKRHEVAKSNVKKIGSPVLTFTANWDKVYVSWKTVEITAKTAMELTDSRHISFYKPVGITDE